jgi:predicted nucleotidyltransferase
MPSLIQKKSYGSVKVFWLERELAISVLKERAVRLVQKNTNVLAVILFGSLAENRAIPGSDADILIVLSESNERFIDRPLNFFHYFEGLGLPVELFCYTEDEIPRVPLAKAAAARGLVLAKRELINP